MKYIISKDCNISDRSDNYDIKVLFMTEYEMERLVCVLDLMLKDYKQNMLQERLEKELRG